MGAIERKICRVVIKEFDRERFGAVTGLTAPVLELARVRIHSRVAGDARLGIRPVQHDSVVERRLLPGFCYVAVRTRLTPVEALMRVIGLVAIDAGLTGQ
jgi:hypothetical protein